ncbi:MAG: hypothetical protein WCW13_04025 [archaeon]|jgi:DNA-binding Lrp family transcriptional regulator
MVKTKTKRVISLLLDSEYKAKSKYEISKKANCSPSWVLMLTKTLEKKGLLKGLKVIKTKELFKMFHKIRPKKQITREYAVYNLENTDKLIEILSHTNHEYAFTTYIAENLVQKYLFNHRTDIYIKEGDLEDWHKEFTKIGAYGGGNIRLIVATHDELFNKKQAGGKKGAWIVSQPQLISDLYTESGPAKEAGDMLLQKLSKSIEAKK